MWRVAALAVAFFQVASQDLQQEGIKAIEAQRYTEAVASLEKAVAADPKSAHARYYLGYALSMLKRDEESIAAYRKAIELQPDLKPAQLNLGLVLMRQNKPGEAVAVLEPVVQADPKQYGPLFALAEAMLAAGNPAGAEVQYKAALELNPKSASAESGLGRALVKQGRLSDADSHYRKAAELDPSHTEALLELASLYEHAKQTKEAIALYEKFPDNAVARERLGELLLESGQAAAAIPNLESAVAASPTSANRYALAMAYIAEKEYGKAETLFTESLKTEPANISLRMNYARVLREQKKYEPAAQEFYRVTQAKPDSVEAWSDLAGMLILLERDEQAIAALDKVRSLGAEKAAHYYFRAIVLDKHKVLQPALESYEKFLAMSEGKNPDEEFKARQRVRILKKELSKK
jgi:tetratricopeptide (TPR) repeat protein